MRYIVIDADGGLAERDRPGRSQDLIRREVGEPGYDIAVGGPNFGVFVNDTGHVLGLARNVIGTCIVATIQGRPIGPLAGPVVITGWHEVDPLGDELEPCSLSPGSVHDLRATHHDLRILLGQEAGVLSLDAHELWQQNMRRLAAQTETAPTPTIEILTGDDALRHLLGDQP